MKETCKMSDAGPLDPIQTRLYHSQSRRYICFNRKGKVRTVVSLKLTFFSLFLR